MNETKGATATVAPPHFTLSILHAAQAIGDQLEEALSGVGLSMAKQSALTQLAQAGEPLTLSELAARLSCVRSNITRSEEHTSELQSQSNLVCRLLLEKK